RAASEAAVADEQLALAPDQGTAALPPRLTRLAASLAAAAAAQLDQIDALIAEASLPRDVARRQHAIAEPALPIAATLAAPLDGLPRDRIAAWGDAPASELLVLAGHVEALHAAGALLARHALDPTALRPLLVAAARTARAAARSARIATGAIPLRARLAYQRAAALGAGTLDDQLAALTALWASTDASRTAGVLARN
ncbi:MAG TPA: hypothetical protein VGC42_28810, partial [Kofleriaceae bacterium]